MTNFFPNLLAFRLFVSIIYKSDFSIHIDFVSIFLGHQLSLVVLELVDHDIKQVVVVPYFADQFVIVLQFLDLFVVNHNVEHDLRLFEILSDHLLISPDVVVRPLPDFVNVEWGHFGILFLDVLSSWRD